MKRSQVQGSACRFVSVCMGYYIRQTVRVISSVSLRYTMLPIVEVLCVCSTVIGSRWTAKQELFMFGCGKQVMELYCEMAKPHFLQIQTRKSNNTLTN